MLCPFCSFPNTSVKDSRIIDGAIKRRRSCPSCLSRFTTFEKPQLFELTVIKKNGKKVPFDKDKLLKSIKTAIHKKSLDKGTIDEVVSSIVQKLATSGESEITTEQIGKLVLINLLKLDPVAYVRFASIYQEFASIKDFLILLERFENEDEVKSYENQLKIFS